MKSGTCTSLTLLTTGGKFCKQTLQQELHHHPSRGGPDEKEKHETWYRQTCELYQTTFQAPPPGDIWPPPKPIEAPPFLPTVVFTQLKYKHLLFFLLPLLFIGILFRQPNPYHLTGHQFLFFFSTFVIVAWVLAGNTWRKKTAELSRLFQQNLECITPEDVAMLTNNAEYLEHQQLQYALDNLVLEPTMTEGNFAISKAKAAIYPTTFTKMLIGFSSETISGEEIKQLLARAKEALKTKHRPLENAYAPGLEVYILNCLVMAIAISRLLQGIANGRPVGFLILLTLLFAIVSNAISRTYSFKNTCRYLFERSVNKPEVQPITTDLWFFGLLSFWMVNGLGGPSTTRGGDGSGGCSGGGCGSSCGGGCGGGCGGCGG